MAFTFKKEERLCSKILIDDLFDRNAKDNFSVMSFPFKIVFKPISNTENLNKNSVILISVSKRSFKKAVDRNLIKRRVREAYRLHKSEIEKELYRIAFIYVGKVILDFQSIEIGMKNGLKKIKNSNPKIQI